MTGCPECEAQVKLADDVMEGEIVECPDCGLELEVIGKKDDGYTLKPAPEEEEDWGE